MTIILEYFCNSETTRLNFVLDASQFSNKFFVNDLRLTVKKCFLI